LLLVQKPSKRDAFDITDDEKIEKKERRWKHFVDIGNGFDRRQYEGVPNRVAKCLWKDFWRIKSDRKPKASTFENNYKYGEMLVKKHRYVHLRTPFYL
jgi:GTP cyclohydrolase I